MNKFLFYILLFASLLITNCDDVNTVNPQLNYKEYVVVRAEIKPNIIFEGIRITKTLPINEPYDTSKAFIKNVIAYLKIDGVKIVPLHYYQNGLYMPYGNILPAPNETFELFASLDNVPFYAITKIPYTPEITNLNYVGRHIDVNVKSHPGEVYGAVWAIVNPVNESPIDVANDFLSIVESSNPSFSTTTFLITKDLPDKYNSDAYKNYRCAKVYAYDKPYLKYFQTKNNNQPVSNIFVQGGDQIIWNVQGDNVIGMFIGVAEGIYVHSN
jgi:hypothetical protein